MHGSSIFDCIHIAHNWLQSLLIDTRVTSANKSKDNGYLFCAFCNHETNAMSNDRIWPLTPIMMSLGSGPRSVSQQLGKITQILMYHATRYIRWLKLVRDGLSECYWILKWSAHDSLLMSKCTRSINVRKTPKTELCLFVVITNLYVPFDVTSSVVQGFIILLLTNENNIFISLYYIPLF